MTTAELQHEALNGKMGMSTLSRKHYSRLRYFWQGRGQGVTSLADTVDLDLVAAELIVRIERPFGGAYFSITPAGEKELAVEKEREIERRRPHHDLAGRLAAWLRDQGRVTWENIELMTTMVDGQRQAIRPDVFSMAATYDEKRINPCVHEVKISRADFLADIAKPEKRAGYAKVAEVTYYAAPAGMIDANEVPAECGLVVEIEIGSFKIMKRPKKKRVELSTHHFMNLILKQGSLNPL